MERTPAVPLEYFFFLRISMFSFDGDEITRSWRGLGELHEPGSDAEGERADRTAKGLALLLAFPFFRALQTILSANNQRKYWFVSLQVLPSAFYFSFHICVLLS